ncbi:MAG: polyphosphate kinase 2 family protein [Bacteriovorax sp.]|nr:polyphosphate kinase 2 family protein [Bacteriovorax sp.]
MSKNKKEHLKINSNEHLKLAKAPVEVEHLYSSEKHYKSLLETNNALLDEYQTMLYAGHAKAMLIIFQGMDTSGKDGAIKHVMSGVNPQGCVVVSFKIPTATDLDHDFLWRENQALPARGQIGIFNRSYYEEALITRVHPKILAKEKLPIKKKPKNKFWQDRYQDIVNHELYLHRQGYEIIKIFIHISKDEQKKRLLERFDNPKKLWKISEGDFRERGFWEEYQSAYETCINHTASKSCPWYVVPGDDKKNARLIISQILVDRFKKMELKYPKLNPEDRLKLEKLKSSLDEKDK